MGYCSVRLEDRWDIVQKGWRTGGILFRKAGGQVGYCSVRLEDKSSKLNMAPVLPRLDIKAKGTSIRVKQQSAG